MAAGLARAMTGSKLFRSWFMAGFECSTMQFWDGRRVDAIADVGHDRLAAEDYALVAEHGLLTARDGLRWPLIERRRGEYDWSSWLPMLRAARRTGVQVIWDLLHFGLPDDLQDPWSGELPDRFAAFCEAAARVFRDETDADPLWAPVNEISYWAYAGGHQGYFQPMGQERGDEWKRQLVRCAIAGVDAVRSVDARARCVHTDPVVHVIPGSEADREAAEGERQLMFHAWDGIAGRRWEDLGGSIDRLDILGVNYYSENQWLRDAERPQWNLNRRTVGLAQPGYRPFHEILLELWDRYGRPMIIAETGAEGANGPGWLRYVTGEVEIARRAGAVVEGICLYPVTDYCGWGDSRHCRCGLVTLEPGFGGRGVDPLMAAELRRERRILELGAADSAAQHEVSPIGGLAAVDA